jgi:hypothetical protein
MLATNPISTGSAEESITMGSAGISSLAARIASGPAARMTSTFRSSRSLASAGRRLRLVGAKATHARF